MNALKHGSFRAGRKIQGFAPFRRIRVVDQRKQRFREQRIPAVSGLRVAHERTDRGSLRRQAAGQMAAGESSRSGY